MRTCQRQNFILRYSYPNQEMSRHIRDSFLRPPVPIRTFLLNKIQKKMSSTYPRQILHGHAPDRQTIYNFKGFPKSNLKLYDPYRIPINSILIHCMSLSGFSLNEDLREKSFSIMIFEDLIFLKKTKLLDCTSLPTKFQPLKSFDFFLI